jgi:hypothetical protein
MWLINFLFAECSIPVLIPYLSLQVRLSLSKHILRDLDAVNKVALVRESFLDSILNDITDIAILQEVIQRSQVSMIIKFHRRVGLGWGKIFLWFDSSVQTMEHIFLSRKFTVYNR